MIALNHESWPTVDEGTEGIAFFAQVWQEMLFDHTLDSYKVRTLNLPRLCEELISSYKLYEAGVLSPHAITPICEEILDGLQHDKTCVELIGSEMASIRIPFVQWSSNPGSSKDVSFAASVIVKKVSDRLKDVLMQKLAAAVRSPREKREIQALAGDLLTELIRIGHSPQQIYFETMQHFFAANRMSVSERFQDFIHKFDGKTGKYAVVFRMPSRASLLTRILDKRFAYVNEKPEPRLVNDDLEREYYADTKPGELLMFFPDIEARDPFAAAREAGKRLDALASLVGFVVHRLDVDVPEKFLVYLGEPPSRAWVLRSPKKPTLKRGDPRDDDLDESLANTFEPVFLSELESNTRRRIDGALLSHYDGIHAVAANNQFSNMWTALETLVASTADRDTITTVLECSIPLLCRKYLLKLVCALRKDIKHLLLSPWREAQKRRGSDEPELCFLLRVLVTDDCKDLRDTLYGACTHNPLLRHRISRIRDTLLSRDLARDAINDHERRVRWHIQRMYRVRNALVHAGMIEVPFIDQLVENLHGYVDAVFQEIVKRLGKEQHHPTLEMVYFECKADYEGYKRLLSSIPDSADQETKASLLVFGHDSSADLGDR
jgi:hypothetical protein